MTGNQKLGAAIVRVPVQSGVTAWLGDPLESLLSPPEEPTDVFTAILAVRKAVQYVQKDQWNGAQKYNYVSDRAIIDAVRPAMLEHGLLLLPAEDGLRQDKAPNGKGLVAAGTLHYMLHHVPSSTSYSFGIPACGYDTLDKGAYKAMTGGQKYALRLLFMLSTGDDPEKKQAGVTMEWLREAVNHWKHEDRGALQWKPQHLRALLAEYKVDRPSQIAESERASFIQRLEDGHTQLNTLGD